MPCTLTTILPMILGLTEFVAALSDLKRGTVATPRVRDSSGAMQAVELAFKDGAGRDAGLVKTDNGYKIVTDSSGLTADQMKAQTKSIQQVVQRYAYRKAVKDLQAQGYVVAEEQKQGDDSLRVVLRKWS